MEFGDALVPRFTHVRSVLDGVDVVRIEVERNPTHGVKCGNFDDGHVVGGSDAQSGDVDAGAAAHVGGSGTNAGVEQRFQSSFTKAAAKDKGVSAPPQTNLRRQKLLRQRTRIRGRRAP